MGAQGVAVVDFGAFPGVTDASVAITGQASILSTSLVEAYLYPAGSAAATPLNTISSDGTADHMGDEHRLEDVKVVAMTIVAATGFTIYARAPENPGDGGNGNGTIPALSPRDGIRLYGKYTVAWVWN